ncbi:membrane protein [Aliivibrio salmonicida]|uniref:Membrane protein n=1 Tax=Aliivibrio salmonicida (strain LFI1238) TaxID=316275 RepID=B6ET49_ALISL|nr:membrane protein [Aliivibrio salmonicida]CAQ81937.1 membrane protein [Aliivibrio salmonicida LFI1238]
MNSTILKPICIVLSIATASLSAILTAQFMYGIGLAMGELILMTALGIVLDLAKCATPLFVLFLFSQKQYASALFALVLSMTLSVVSFSASVAALEQGVVASQKNSTAYQAVSQQIKEYTTQVDELRLLAAKQQNANLITKSERTLEKIEPLLVRIDDLYQRQSTLPSELTVFDKFGLLISYITSAALELMSWLLVLVSNALKRSHTHSNAVVRSHDKSSALELIQPDFIQTQLEIEPQSCAVNDEYFNDCVSEPVDCHEEEVFSDDHLKCNEQVYLEIKQAVLAKEVKPSQRGIGERFKGVGRDTINFVLMDLKHAGFLRSYRKGYAFA